MIRGRHRGLPLAIDRAVLLPSDLVQHGDDAAHPLTTPEEGEMAETDVEAEAEEDSPSTTARQPTSLARTARGSDDSQGTIIVDRSEREEGGESTTSVEEIPQSREREGDIGDTSNDEAIGAPTSTTRRPKESLEEVDKDQPGWTEGAL